MKKDFSAPGFFNGVFKNYSYQAKEAPKNAKRDYSFTDRRGNQLDSGSLEAIQREGYRFISGGRNQVGLENTVIFELTKQLPKLIDEVT